MKFRWSTYAGVGAYETKVVDMTDCLIGFYGPSRRRCGESTRSEAELLLGCSLSLTEQCQSDGAKAKILPPEVVQLTGQSPDLNELRLCGGLHIPPFPPTNPLRQAPRDRDRTTL